jgi:hypothetical protein
VKSATEVWLELKMCHCTECMTALEQAMAEARAEGRRETLAAVETVLGWTNADDVREYLDEQAAKGAAPAAPEAQDPDKFLRDMERAREQLAAEGIAVRPEDWDDAQAKGERDGE